jgi:hypothetical protein
MGIRANDIVITNLANIVIIISFNPALNQICRQANAREIPRKPPNLQLAAKFLTEKEYKSSGRV